MKLLSTDLYINCYNLIHEANILYETARQKQMHAADKKYIETMNKYINIYDRYKQQQIKQ